MLFRNHAPMAAQARCQRFAIWRACLWLAIGMGSMSPAMAGKREFKVAPPEEWVVAISPEETPSVPAEQLSEGTYYLLSDLQTRVEGGQQTQYRHLAAKAVNEKGVEAISHVEIKFDPAFQTLVLHAINIRRDGRVIPKLASSTVRVLQRETDLERLIYDGSKSANVFIDDVRVGDVIEYAYTVRGFNPAFGGHLFGQIDLQWNAPVHQVHARLLWPAGRELYLKPHRTDLAALVNEHDGYREYRWQKKDVPGLTIEADAPAWYDPYPAIQWSEFSDWEAVARWVAPLYRVPAALGPALQAEVDRIAQSQADPEGRMAEALRFVQREIRYLGMEVGSGSHVPTSPPLVLERRFGDCKDKALLTVTLLRALGIDAQPALVNTSLQGTIEALHPTPAAFNHVLVRARLDGREYWLDPTRPPQQGTLSRIYQPDYGLALLVDPGTRSLSSMSTSVRPPAKQSIHTLIDASAGLKQPVRYSVTTVAEGASADRLRDTLASNNREELQKQYLNYYTHYYAGIKVEAPISVVDDVEENRLTQTERYVIPEFWTRAEEQKRDEAEIYAPDTEQYLRRPSQSVRRAPLQLGKPLELTSTTEVILYETWGVKAERTVIEGPVFRLERDVASKGRVVTLTDHYSLRAEHVMPEDIARYVANLDRARNALGYVLYANDVTTPATPNLAERFNWPVAGMATLMLLGLIQLAVKLYRYDPPPVASAVMDPDLEGIRGWLLLPALGVALTPVRILVDLAMLAPSYAADSWAVLTTAGGAAYHPFWAPVLLFELAANIGLLVFSVVLAVLFFQKRRGTPRVYVAYAAGSALIHLLNLLFVRAMQEAGVEITARDWGELSHGVLGALIWGSYFLFSRRVKATFVQERRAVKPEQLSPEPA